MPLFLQSVHKIIISLLDSSREGLRKGHWCAMGINTFQRGGVVDNNDGETRNLDHRVSFRTPSRMRSGSMRLWKFPVTSGFSIICDTAFSRNSIQTSLWLALDTTTLLSDLPFNFR